MRSSGATGSDAGGFLPGLLHHLPHCRRRTGRLFFAPRFQPLASVLNVRKELRILECGAPGGHDISHAVPYRPNLTIAFEKKLVVNQAAVDDAGDHLPVTDEIGRASCRETE